MKEKYALLSLSDKTNLETLVTALNNHNYLMIGTTSTSQAIKNLGYDCKLIEDITSFPEMLDGRVKTLQPQIHGGILADLNKESHLADLEKHDINPISLVVCNLYPFEQVLDDESARHEKVAQEENVEKITLSLQQMHSNLIENIDIGGVTLLRAAAKNYQNVTLLCNPSDYKDFIDALDNETLSADCRLSLAMKGYIHTANYDSMIANYFMTKNGDSSQLLVSAPLKQQLRYGENPHQNAFYYENEEITSFSLSSSQIIQGKELSYNNILDIEAAYQTISEFETPCAVALKHNTPCGIGFDKNIIKAYEKCCRVDPISIFGGIVILNRPVEVELAQKINEIFLEIVIAPKFSEEALAIFSNKANLRLLKGDFNHKNLNNAQLRSINGGYLRQIEEPYDLKLTVVSQTKLNDKTMLFLEYLYKTVKNVKSNAVVIGQGDEILGLSGGMVSRIDACDFALKKTLLHDSYLAQKPLLLASDGFFPFNDIIELALEYNIKYIIQPGGSINDKKMLEACDEHGIAMIFTGIRHFKH